MESNLTPGAETSKLRFFLDGNAGLTKSHRKARKEIAKVLAEFGINVTSLPSQRTFDSSEMTQWEYCKKEGRVMITHNSNYLRIAEKDLNHPGLIHCKIEMHFAGEIVLGISELYNELSPGEMRGKILYM
ncbi:MAG: DUF5615 family PIN-like protein [bacterium]